VTHRDEAGNCGRDIKRSSKLLAVAAISKNFDNESSVSTIRADPQVQASTPDNRDVRRERAVKGEELDYIFMIRVGVPGGRLTTDQWLALDRRRSTSPTAR